MTVSTMQRSPGHSQPNRKLSEAEWDVLFDKVYGPNPSSESVEELTKNAGVSRARFYKKRQARIAAQAKKKTPGDQTEGSSDATELSGPTTVNDLIVPEGSTTGQADQETEQ